jgi:RNA polymerase sigma-70 factor (ECF subfamily)
VDAANRPATNATTILLSRHPVVVTDKRYDDSPASAIVGLMSGLVRGFEQESGAAGSGAAGVDGAVLEDLLAALYRRGHAAHPRLAVPEPAFGRYLARCAADGDFLSLAQLVIEDVYLACACAERVRGAEAVFDRRFRRTIRRAVSRVLTSADEREEAEQRTWQHLLVRERNKLPRIAQYLGQGPLEKWVSVASTRVAISFGRGETAERRLRKKAIVEATGVDAERLLMKGELREVIESAITRGLDGLTARERLVLKLYLVSGMTLDAIARSLGVSRQAVTKSLGRARTSILGEVEEALRDRMKMSKDDLASVLRLIASQLDVNLSRVLGNA